LDGRHYCPTCLETGKTKRKIQSLDNHRTLYDSVALAVALYPLIGFLFFWYATLITAPMAIYIALRYWKAPLGILRRTHVRFVAAILLALLQIGAWVTFITLVKIHTHHHA
jgi:hypothetical protein